MLVLEAALLAHILDRLQPSRVLDIGSGSRAGREVVQPHIAAAFNGHEVVWADLEPSHNTLMCDLTRRETLHNLPQCELVTACSVLEHVQDIKLAISNLAWMTHRWLIVSVPCNFPEHHCPIDNLWRPSADELAAKLEAEGLLVDERYHTSPEYFGGVTDAQAALVVARKPDGWQGT